MELSARPGIRSHITLALCTVLHAFSHAYGCLLVPLYLLMRDDLHLNGVRKASLVVTVYGLMFCLPSYPAGLLADRFNRKRIVVVTQILLGCCSLGLAALTFTQGSVALQLEMWRPDKPGQLAALTLTQGSLVLVYLVLLMVGILRAFNNPAASTLLPQTVPPEKFTSAAAWSSSAWQ